MDDRYELVKNLTSYSELGHTLLVSDPCHVPDDIIPLFTVDTSVGRNDIYNFYRCKDIKISPIKRLDKKVGVDTAKIGVYLLREIKEIYPCYEPNLNFQAIFKNIISIDVYENLAQKQEIFNYHKFLELIPHKFPKDKKYYSLLF